MTSEFEHVSDPGFSPGRGPTMDEQNLHPTWKNMTPHAAGYDSQQQRQKRKPLGDSTSTGNMLQQYAGPPSFAGIKSPTTLCFERMLGAAASIATPKPVAAKKKKKATKTKRRHTVPSSNLDNTIDDLSELDVIGGEQQPPIEERIEDENPFVIIQRDPVLFKKLVLTMALQRQPKEAKDSESVEVPPPIITEGFYWKDYPQCEALLYDSMARYYELSKSSRQSKEQQAFNNQLVSNIRNVANDNGYTFDATYFNDKRLRDRIRCFFKTHLQNAKKRLNTMQKHPESLENQQALRALIRMTRSRMTPEDQDQDPFAEEAEEEEYRPDPKRRRSR